MKNPVKTLKHKLRSFATKFSFLNGRKEKEKPIEKARPEIIKICAYVPQTVLEAISEVPKEPKSESCVQLADLPGDALSNIFRFLRKRDRISLASTCKSFRETYFSHFVSDISINQKREFCVIKTIGFNDHKVYRMSGIVHDESKLGLFGINRRRQETIECRRYCIYPSLLKSLDVHGDDEMALLLSDCGNLQRLSITSVKIDDEVIDAILKNVNLVALEIVFCDFNIGSLDYLLSELDRMNPQYPLPHIPKPYTENHSGERFTYPTFFYYHLKLRISRCLETCICRCPIVHSDKCSTHLGMPREWYACKWRNKMLPHGTYNKRHGVVFDDRLLKVIETWRCRTTSDRLEISRRHRAPYGMAYVQSK